MKTTDPRRLHARRIVGRLARLYPDANCALDYDNPLQLLVATILSAQCTDARVNLVTPALFTRYPDADAFATAVPRELHQLLRSVNFYRNKTRSIIKCCRQLVERHGGQVPRTMEELVPLHGIGRKTANVILSNGFGVPGIVVDTHLGRLARRMGLTTETNPVKVERDLMGLLPRRQWSMFSHRMIIHGRQVCHARKPDCAGCALARICPKEGVEGPHAKTPGRKGRKKAQRETGSGPDQSQRAAG
jgi:endonuclease-3